MTRSNLNKVRAAYEGRRGGAYFFRAARSKLLSLRPTADGELRRRLNRLATGDQVDLKYAGRSENGVVQGTLHSLSAAVKAHLIVGSIVTESDEPGVCFYNLAERKELFAAFADHRWLVDRLGKEHLGKSVCLDLLALGPSPRLLDVAI